MQRSYILAVIVLAGMWPASWALVGCLTAITDLVERAEVVVLARVDSIEKAMFVDCAAEPLEDDRLYPVRYDKCGGVFRLTVSPIERLKGAAAALHHVYVARESLFVLGCDDRPSVDEMTGLTVLFVLETDRGRLWSLDGPNGLYAWSKKPASGDSILQEVRSLCSQTSSTKTAG